MKPKLDWHYLAPTLIVILVAALATILMVYFSYRHHTDIQGGYDIEQAKYQEALEHYKEAKDDMRFLEHYRGRFEALETAGIFVAEQRVGWVDSLHAVIGAMKLSNVKYEVGPQRVSSEVLTETDENIRINESQLKIEMNLLHEQDMLTLLDRLERKVVGRFLVERCEMKRAEIKFRFYPGRHNLNVNCDLKWLTLSPIEQTPGEGV